MVLPQLIQSLSTDYGPVINFLLYFALFGIVTKLALKNTALREDAGRLGVIIGFILAIGLAGFEGFRGIRIMNSLGNIAPFFMLLLLGVLTYGLAKFLGAKGLFTKDWWKYLVAAFFILLVLGNVFPSVPALGVIGIQRIIEALNPVLNVLGILLFGWILFKFLGKMPPIVPAGKGKSAPKGAEKGKAMLDYSKPGKINVTVKHAAGEVVKGAEVIITGVKSGWPRGQIFWRRRGPYYKQITDSKGKANFRGVPSGNLRIIVKHPDYKWYKLFSEGKEYYTTYFVLGYDETKDLTVVLREKGEKVPEKAEEKKKPETKKGVEAQVEEVVKEEKKVDEGLKKVAELLVKEIDIMSGVYNLLANIREYLKNVVGLKSFAYKQGLNKVIDRIKEFEKKEKEKGAIGGAFKGAVQEEAAKRRDKIRKELAGISLREKELIDRLEASFSIFEASKKPRVSYGKIGMSEGEKTRLKQVTNQIKDLIDKRESYIRYVNWVLEDKLSARRVKKYHDIKAIFNDIKGHINRAIKEDVEKSKELVEGANHRINELMSRFETMKKWNKDLTEKIEQIRRYNDQLNIEARVEWIKEQVYRLKKSKQPEQLEFKFK